MRILGIDHGEVRLGLAISDEGGVVARPLLIIKHVSRETDAETVARLAAEKDVKLIIVGLPTDEDGEIGHQARKVKRWAEALTKATAIPIKFWDESFSSVDADSAAPNRKTRKEPNDDRAAAIMLQNYLDAHPASPRKREARDTEDIPAPEA